MDYSAHLQKTAKEQERRVIIGDVSSSDPDSPAYECQSYRDQLEDVVLMREVVGGTKTMRAAGEKYLPRHPMEQDPKYEVRKKIAVAFNALARTTSGLVGMIFRRDPVESDDMDAAIKEALTNIDLRGHSLPIFLHSLAEDALLDGHIWIHVEAPPAGSVGTRAEERQKGVRPYWVAVRKKQAINIRYVMRGGEPVLTLFVYREGGTKPKGDFGEEAVERIRVLREITPGMVRGELWEFEDKSETEAARWVRVEDYAVDSDRVPVVFLPSKRGPSTGPFESEPPLRDLAYEQIEHYRVRSDRQKSLTFSSIAVAYKFGRETIDTEGKPKIAWGPDGMMLSNDAETKAGMIESHGYGLEASKAELADIAARMASLGLQMLVRPSGTQPRDNQTTATSDVLRRSESDASLVLFADAIESAANEALKIQASYSAKKPSPGTVAVNRDFEKQLLDAQRLKALHEVVLTDDMSRRRFWMLLQEGEVLPADFDPDEEEAEIEKQIARRMAQMPELELPDDDVITDDAA